MNRPILTGVCAVILVGAADALAEQHGHASTLQADTNPPASIACAQQPDVPLGECSYLIERDEAGKVTLTAIFPNGFKRLLFFEDGRFLKASVTMSGVGTDTDWHVEDETHIIRVDRQRYEVPGALILGQ